MAREIERVPDSKEVQMHNGLPMGKVRCPECSEPTNKFVGECENCGHDRWANP